MNWIEEGPSAKSLSELFAAAPGSYIDSSSYILMQKGGYVQRALRALSLTVPCAACRELSLRDCPFGACQAAADAQILELAQAHKTALISNDRQILMRARQLAIPHMNSLMTLVCLYHLHEIDEREYLIFRDRLRPIARYAPWIWVYGEKAYEIIYDRRNSS